MVDIEVEKIIKGCQKQKINAQEKLYKLFYEQMFRVCINYSKNTDVAKDYLQDGFLKVFKNINKYQFQGSFEGWMKMLFINNILDDIKKKDVLKNTSDQCVGNLLSNSSLNSGEANLELEHILNIMKQLPNKTRIVFMLFVVDGYSHKEISKELNIALETSKWHVKEARTFFKNNYSNLKV